MEQKRIPRNEPTTIWTINLRQSKRENIQWEKRQCLQHTMLGKLDSNIQKKETGPLYYTIHKNQFKMNERPKCET